MTDFRHSFMDCAISGSISLSEDNSDNDYTTITHSIIDDDGDVTPEVTADNGSSSLSLGSLDIKR